jgi:hypothetical protein
VCGCMTMGAYYSPTFEETGQYITCNGSKSKPCRGFGATAWVSSKVKASCYGMAIPGNTPACLRQDTTDGKLGNHRNRKGGQVGLEFLYG